MKKHVVSLAKHVARFSLCLVGASLFLPHYASAIPTIANGSFEDPAQTAPGVYSSVPITDWVKTFNGRVSLVNGNIQDNNGNDTGATPFGAQYIGLDKRGLGFVSGISQTVSDFTAGQAYLLTLYVADFDGGPAPVLEVLLSDNAGTDYVDNLYNVVVGGPYGDTIQFNEVTIPFIAPVDGDITLSLYNSSAYYGPPNSFDIDNVSIAAVPEPSSWALLGIGAVSFVVLRRRQRAA